MSTLRNCAFLQRSISLSDPSSINRYEKWSQGKSKQLKRNIQGKLLLKKRQYNSTKASTTLRIW